jgi:hypothetical protein
MKNVQPIDLGDELEHGVKFRVSSTRPFRSGDAWSASGGVCARSARRPDAPATAILHRSALIDYVIAAETRSGQPLALGDALAELLADITDAARHGGSGFCRQRVNITVALHAAMQCSQSDGSA